MFNENFTANTDNQNRPMAIRIVAKNPCLPDFPKVFHQFVNKLVTIESVLTSILQTPADMITNYLLPYTPQGTRN